MSNRSNNQTKGQKHKLKIQRHKGINDLIYMQQTGTFLCPISKKTPRLREIESARVRAKYHNSGVGVIPRMFHNKGTYRKAGNTTSRGR
jgi:hypothetical protein